MMRLFCWVGFHRSGCYRSEIGQPWVFYMHCVRCGKKWRNSYWLPPQPEPIRRPEPHPDFSSADG